MDKYKVTRDIVEHMARAFFASAWADQEEESGNAQGGEIMDRMPSAIDPAAIHATRTLAFDMARANGRNLSEIYDAAETVWIESGREGDRPFNAEMFGHYCAMQAMGHGVGLRDAFGRDVSEFVKVPYVAFSGWALDRDYF